jgi:outer membrane protein assembly factor BamB
VHARSGERLVSIRLATGDIVKQRPAPPLDLWDGILLDGCLVSFVEDLETSEGGRLEAWEIATGASRWSVPRAFDPVPIAGERNLVVAAGHESITAYDVRDGRSRWTSTLEAGEVIGALVIAQDGSVLAALSKEIVAIDGATGDVRWRTAAAVARAGTMAVSDDGEIHLLDWSAYRRLSAETGAVVFARDLERSARPTIRGSLGRLSVGRSHVFAADQRGPLVAVSRTSGAIDWKWEETRRRAASVAPVLSSRRLYALAADGTLQTFVSAT